MALYLGISNNGTFVSSDGAVLQDCTGVSLRALPATTKLKVVLNGIAYRVNVNLNSTTKESE